MDHRLVAWGRAVKARRRLRLPPLWLFSDAVRTPALEAAVRALPRGLCGVVFRHDSAPDRMALLSRVARLCRERRLALVVAGGGGAALGGVHLRRGRGRVGRPRNGRIATSSAHGVAELVRARRAGVDAAFLSPCMPTRSHAGATALGLLRWSLLARSARLPVFALGGIDGASVRRLPRDVAGVGAIGALLA